MGSYDTEGVALLQGVHAGHPNAWLITGKHDLLHDAVGNGRQVVVSMNQHDRIHSCAAGYEGVYEGYPPAVQVSQLRRRLCHQSVDGERRAGSR